MPDILNLGAGDRIIEGAVNHDIWAHRPEIDAVWDLNETPWPWLDNSFDEIEFISVVEHLKLTPIESLDQCWRIIRNNGQLIIKYPLHSGPTTHDDPTHRWFLSERALDFVDPDTRYGQVNGYYTSRKWRIVNRGIIKERNVKAILTPRGK